MPENAPTTPPPYDDPAPRFTLAKTALQLAGFAISIALLAWVVSQAVNDDNREAWQRLADAGPALIAALVAATAGNIAVNGMIFHAVARPVRRFSPLYLVAMNALATLLASLPFKLSVIIRGLIHARRDHMSVKLIAAWFVAVGGLGLATLALTAIISLSRQQADTRWFIAVFLALTATHTTAIVLSRIAARDDSRVAKPLRRLSIGAWRFLQHPQAAIGHALWRTLDFALLAARFYLAARILGIELSPGQALLLGTTFFLVSISAPAGNLGFREFATVFIAEAVGIQGSIAALAIIVSFTELLTAFALSVPAFALIRPDRLLRAKRRPPAAPDRHNTPTSPAPTSGPTPLAPDNTADQSSL